LTPANAQEGGGASSNNQGPGLTSDVQDPVVELQVIRQKRETPTYSLFPKSPLTPFRDAGLAAEKRIYEATDIKFGTAVNTLLQGLSDEIPGTDDFGMATFLSFVGTWDGFHKGCPHQGEVTFGLEGRWDWGTTPPTDLGPNSLGSLGFTANPFGAYTPTFLVRNLFWRQGSREAGWMYRVGRVTPDQFLNTSRHITPLTSYLPIAGTGGFAMGLPDSGLGMFAGLFVNDRVNVAGVVSDSNADRFDFGDIDEGDLFTALEFQVKVFPVTEKAGYSKVTFWHNDGTKFGNAINGSTGKEGWGVFVKHEQELTCDGRMIAIGRWGKNHNESALYDQQAAAHLVLYDPLNSGNYQDDLFNADLLGVAYNWVQPSAADRDESNVELFYRFPLFPHVDTTLSYQMIFNPALDPSNDFGSAFSFRFRSLW
jgi:porin